ncbi:MAG: hypothetical protein KAW39_08355 [Thermoplasmata archaeon]|nr:hypothetical protein [Thermoplasmata archaeon]
MLSESGNGTDSEERGCQEKAAKMILDALESVPREDIDRGLLSVFDELGVYTEEQKTVYGNIVRLSPTALHLTVFLPLPKLLE